MGGICQGQLISHAQLHISSLQHLPICKLTLGAVWQHLFLGVKVPSHLPTYVSICSLQLLIYQLVMHFRDTNVVRYLQIVVHTIHNLRASITTSMWGAVVAW